MSENDDITVTIDAVKKIKAAILQSRYMAARLANREQLKLYFSIGAYISLNSRTGKWGTGAIEAISRRLQVELPGLKGFSARSITYMRTFFEEWGNCSILNRHLPSADLFNDENRQLAIADFAITKKNKGNDEKTFPSGNCFIEDFIFSIMLFPFSNRNGDDYAKRKTTVDSCNL